MINTVPCTPDEAKELIKSLRSLKLSFMLWGATGVGKSEAVRQLSCELNAELRDIRLCQKQPTDIGGLPALDHANRQTVFYPPAFLAPRARTEKQSFYFSTKSRSRPTTRKVRFSESWKNVGREALKFPTTGLSWRQEITRKI
jgi:hypothetical protein